MPGVPYFNWEFWLVQLIPIAFTTLVCLGGVLALTMPSTRRPPWVEPTEDQSRNIMGVPYSVLDGGRTGALNAIRALLFPLAILSLQLVVAIMAMIELFSGVDAIVFRFEVGYGAGATNALMSSFLMLVCATILNVDVFWPSDG